MLACKDAIMSAPALYELERASVHGPLGRALAPFDLVLRDRAVTALVGPVGSGRPWSSIASTHPTSNVCMRVSVP